MKKSYIRRKNKHWTIIQNSQDGRVVNDLFGDSFERNQWDKAIGDLHIERTAYNGETKTTSYGTKGGSRIVLNISDMKTPKIMSEGLKKVYDKCQSRAILQTLANLSSSKEVEDHQELKRIVDGLSELDKNGNSTLKHGEKSKGEQMFGGRWKMVKELLAKGDYSKLGSIGLTDEEKAYLFGGKTGSVRRMAIRIARETRAERIGKRIVGIGHYEIFDRGKAVARYSTDGQFWFLDKNGDTWYGQISKDEQGLEEARKIVRKYRKLFKERDGEKIKQALGGEWGNDWFGGPYTSYGPRTPL